MIRPLFVSFFTAGTDYAAEAEALVETLERFELDHDVHGVRDLGNWIANTQQKPAFIRRMMEANPGVPIVWLDADARVIEAPLLFNSLAGVEFAAAWRDGTELLSSTMYFAPCAATMALLDAWEAENLANNAPVNGDQGNLEIVVKRMVKDGALRSFRLPDAYAFIADLMPEASGPPVILQTQASRRLRR